jgi:hypothetical protein
MVEAGIGAVCLGKARSDIEGDIRAALAPYLSEPPAGKPAPAQPCTCHMSDMRVCPEHEEREPAIEAKVEATDEECDKLAGTIIANHREDCATNRAVSRYGIRQFLSSHAHAPTPRPPKWRDLSDEQRAQVQAAILLLGRNQLMETACELAKSFGLDDTAARAGRCEPAKGSAK